MNNDVNCVGQKRVRAMNPISRLKRIGITILRQQSVSKGLMLRNLSGGGLLSGMIRYGRKIPL
jgi:hypothetical protein